MTQPVVPLDPMGPYTQPIGKGYAGPSSIGQLEHLPAYEVEARAFPVSDVMDDPVTRADMMQPSTSATMIVGPWWHPDPNVIGDAWQIPNVIGGFGGLLPVQAQQLYTQAFVRLPNTEGGVPGAPRMSDLAASFQQYLAQVQNMLIGTP